MCYQIRDITQLPSFITLKNPAVWLFDIIHNHYHHHHVRQVILHSKSKFSNVQVYCAKILRLQPIFLYLQNTDVIVPNI